MRRDEAGLYHARLSAPVGAAYRYRIDGRIEVPDPASRAQSTDVHGASLVTDLRFCWRHADWRGRPWAETVIYELHVGAYGGFDGVRAQLPRLAALGVTAIELMPIADFPGRHNWGYDGVLPYAPAAAYGSPEALHTLIDTAHGLGLQVFLDVVYNHFGPDGNYLSVYAKSFFRADRATLWGRPSISVSARYGIFSSATRCTGCATTVSTGCASTPCTPSATLLPPGNG